MYKIAIESGAEKRRDRDGIDKREMEQGRMTGFRTLLTDIFANYLASMRRKSAILIANNDAEIAMNRLCKSKAIGPR